MNIKPKKQDSLALGTLLNMMIGVTGVIMLSAWGNYLHVNSNLEKQAKERLDRYISERGERESTLFKLALDNHQILKQEIQRQLTEVKNQDCATNFDNFFYTWSDGSTRNAPESQPLKSFRTDLYPTTFIDKNVEVNAEVKCKTVIFHKLVAQYGPAWKNRFVNTYIGLPRNSVSIYWEADPWALKAAPDEELTDDEVYAVVNETNNPTHQPAWTGPYFDTVANLWMVSLATPIYTPNGQRITTIGHDLVLTDLINHTIQDRLDGAYNMVFTVNGDLIVHPKLMEKLSTSQSKINLKTIDDPHLKHIFNLVSNQQEKHVVLDNTEDRELLASVKLDGPNWYFVTIYPKSLLQKDAWISAQFVLLTGLLALLIELSLLFYVLRRKVALPLNQLIDTIDRVAKGNFKIDLDTTRKDELGRLAQSFQSMANQLDASFSTLESRVAERTEELKEAKVIADKANQAKSIFIANMSHELRSPLNAILGFSQIMTRSQTLGREHQENVGIIYRSGEHLLSLINNVLDLSKIEAGKTTLNPKNFDLHRLLDDIHDMFQMKAEEKNLQLLMEYDPDLIRYVCTDEVKLRQVLINLINNALKFTQNGGVSIRVGDRKTTTNPQQTIALQDSGYNPASCYTLNFEIEDSGAGIDLEEIGQLFEAFNQTETGKKAQEGTGLGLPISRQFVRLMGGDIRVKSQVEQGTTFLFDIQVIQVDASDIATQQPVRRVIALAPNQPTYRLLIVDDKPLNRQLLIKLLSPLGFELQEASNGQEAINTWDNWEPHLIWMDMRMPVMDGYSATQKIKATTKGQATVIIAVTASVLEEEKAVVISAGCDDFLRKPFREEEIFKAMNKHIGVEYIYEDLTSIKTDVMQKREVLNETVIAELPPEILDKLHESVIASNLDLIASVLQQIVVYNEPLSQAIETYLHNFEYEKVLHLIDVAKGG